MLLYDMQLRAISIYLVCGIVLRCSSWIILDHELVTIRLAGNGGEMEKFTVSPSPNDPTKNCPKVTLKPVSYVSFSLEEKTPVVELLILPPPQKKKREDLVVSTIWKIWVKMEIIFPKVRGDNKKIFDICTSQLGALSNDNLFHHSILHQQTNFRRWKIPGLILFTEPNNDFSRRKTCV